jgi:hypothetical protein
VVEGGDSVVEGGNSEEVVEGGNSEAGVALLPMCSFLFGELRWVEKLGK